jgi:uncharacterized protein (TIGR00369 family)
MMAPPQRCIRPASAEPQSLESPMTESAILDLLDRVLAPWVRSLALKPVSVSDESATLRLPFSGELRHSGGVICGQVFMAAADTAMIVAISAALGEFRPMTTVSLNINFMRAVRKGDVLVTARVLRMGRNLVFGEIELHDEEGKMAVHATTTYALIN